MGAEDAGVSTDKGGDLAADSLAWKLDPSPHDL